MYFALPTRSAATQIHGRLVRLVRRAFAQLPEEQQPPVVLAVPGYLRVDERQGIALPDQRVLWPDERPEGPKWVEWQRAWAAEHRKRYLAGAVVAGTVDQVLLSVLRARHAHLRTTALLRSLLVVDEVHASDPYMSALLRQVVARQLTAGGHVLLMSATLGSSARRRFLAAAELPLDPDCDAPQDGTEWPYPAVLVAGRGEGRVQPVGCAPVTERRIEVTVRCWDTEEVAEQALSAAARGARVLVLRNTVREAVELQQRLEALAEERGQRGLLFTVEGVATLHHGRFAPEDRKRLDRAVEQALQPGPRACRGLVVVATQTVEQSLDVDADWLLTDLAPADVLLQRLGRLHRHRETTRPPGASAFATPHAVVLVPAQDLAELLDEQGAPRKGALPMGLGRVYPNLLSLLATARALGEGRAVRVPQDCRPLVEAATATERLAALAEAEGGPWPAHFRWVTGIAQADATHASLVLWRWELPFDQVAFDRELDGEVATRLGERDVQLRLREPVAGPFGGRLSEVRVPGWMLPEKNPAKADAASAEPVVDAEPLPEGGFAFAWADRRFVYDRHGLRLLRPGEALALDEDVSP